MTISQFTDAGGALVRARTSLIDIGICDVHIGKGSPAATTDLNTQAKIAAATDTLGVLAPDSPEWSFEPNVEALDQYGEATHLNASVSVTLKKVNQALLATVEDEMINEEITIVCVPENAAAVISGGGTSVAFVMQGLHIVSKGEGKGNSTTSPSVTLFCDGLRVYKRSEVYNAVVLTA